MTITETSAGYSREMEELDLLRGLQQMYLQARDAKRSRYDNWQRNYRLVNNRLGRTSQSNWMPSPRDSEIYPVLSALVAWMTDQYIIADCVPATDPHSPYYAYVSEVGNQLANIIYSNWLTENYDGAVKLMLWDALMFGLGTLKSVWDSSLDGGYGNAVFRRVDPWSFYVDPMASDFNDAEYFVEVRKMSMGEIERRFGLDAVRRIGRGGHSTIGEFDQKPDVWNSSRREMLSPPGLKLPASGSLSGGGGSLPSATSANYATPSRSRSVEPLPPVVVYEFWLRENEDIGEPEAPGPDGQPLLTESRIKDRWRVIVVAGNRIIMDEPADELWGHGGHPYSRYVFDDIGEMYGISLVDHLAYPQIYINRLLTSLQYNAELIGNPIFVESANSGLDRVGIINRPGQRLRVTGAAAMQNRPDWLRPPEMPKTITDLVQFWISRIENTSGLSAIVKGATPTQRNAEGVISSVQEAAFVRIRASLRNLEKCLEEATVKVIDLIAENYTEPRILAIVGPDGNQVSLALEGNHFYDPSENTVPLKFSCMIKAGASAPTSRQARIAEADKLFAMNAIDDQALLEAHQYPHIAQVLTRKYKKMAAGMQAAGGGQGVRKRAQRTQ